MFRPAVFGGCLLGWILVIFIVNNSPGDGRRGPQHTSGNTNIYSYLYCKHTGLTLLRETLHQTSVLKQLPFNIWLSVAISNSSKHGTVVDTISCFRLIYNLKINSLKGQLFATRTLFPLSILADQTDVIPNSSNILSPYQCFLDNGSPPNPSSLSI